MKALEKNSVTRTPCRVFMAAEDCARREFAGRHRSQWRVGLAAARSRCCVGSVRGRSQAADPGACAWASWPCAWTSWPCAQQSRGSESGDILTAAVTNAKFDSLGFLDGCVARAHMRQLVLPSTNPKSPNNLGSQTVHHPSATPSPTIILRSYSYPLALL